MRAEHGHDDGDKAKDGCAHHLRHVQQIPQQISLYVGHGASADDHGHDDEVIQKGHQVFVQPTVKHFAKGGIVISLVAADDVRSQRRENADGEECDKGEQQTEFSIGCKVDGDIGTRYQRGPQQRAEPHRRYFEGACQ